MLAKRIFAPIRAVKQGLVDETHPCSIISAADFGSERAMQCAERQREYSALSACRKMAAEMMGVMAGFESKDMLVTGWRS